MRRIELKTLEHPKVLQLVLDAIKALPQEASQELVDSTEAKVREGTAVDYKELLRIIIQSPAPGQEAMTTEDMESSSDIIAKLDEITSEDRVRVLVLENAEYKFALNKVEATSWKYADPRFAQFVRDLRNAAIVE